MKTKERKPKLEIIEQINKLLLNKKAWSYNQLAVELDSHWLTIRECCEFMVKYKMISVLKTQDKKTYVFKLKEV